MIRTNPLGNQFNVKPTIKPFKLVELIEDYISDKLLKELSQFEAKIQKDFYNEFRIMSLLIKIFDIDDREKIIQQFLIVFLPIHPENEINMDQEFLSLFEEILKETDSTNNRFDSILIFGAFNYDPQDFNDWIKLFNKNSSNKPWIHLIDRILPIQVEFQPILRDDVISYLSRNVIPFNIICSAFYFLHEKTPQKHKITYNEIIFDNVDNEAFQRNIDYLISFLNHIFENNKNIFQTPNHDLINLEENKESSIETKTVDFFPKFLSNLSDLFKAVIPFSDNGKILRNELGNVFDYGDYESKDLKTCLDLLVRTPAIKMSPGSSSRKKKDRFLYRLNAYKALIELNLINFKIAKKEYFFTLRTDPNSLFFYIDNLITTNIKEDKPFTVIDFLTKIKVPIPKYKTSKPIFIEITEELFEFLTKKRRIFEYYPAEDNENNEEENES